MRICLFAIVAVTLAAFASPFARTSRAADEVLPPIDQRFADLNGEETPDFQRHVSPLFGRLGCNGRSCHGSFQGRGGFRLSLFGYDFQADLDALNDKESPRIDKENPVESLMLAKPADADLHEGGERFKTGSWQYNVFRRWLEAGAKFDSAQVKKLERLEVQPAELLFSDKGQQVQLRAIAVWEDGSREDVTPLCRFQSNSDQVALIDENGLVTSAEPGDTHVVAFYDNAVVPVPVIRPVSNLAGDKYPATPTFNRVDELVLEKLRKLGIVQSETASDAEFLRRLSLDMTGTLPTSEETAAFLADQSPDKRARKIDQLLESPAYAAWWTTRLCDFTGNNDAQIRNVSPQGVRGITPSQHWYDWIHKRVTENTPYDQLVAGILVATSREEGQSYSEFCETMSTIFANKEGASFAELSSMPYFWAKQDLRVPEARSIAVAYSFLGIRIQCAQCHKHPFDQWSKQDFEQFTNFFRHVNYSNGRPRDGKERDEYDAILAKLNIDSELRGNQQRRAYGELLAKGHVVPFPELATVSRPITTRGDMAEPLTTPIETARLLGGETLKTEDYEDVRQPLMDWLRQKDNPYFARAFVNRVWAAYFNVGIIEPPDDINLANPPSNKALLDYLAAGFVDSGFDMKWVHRTIANSRTYQLSWRPNDTNTLDERNFARAVPRRLPAEVVYDAVTQATAADAKVEEMHEQMKGRAIALAGASNRNSNQGSAFALSVFGKSLRESNCDCDRSNESSLLQTVFLQNDRDMLSLLDRGDGWVAQLARADRGSRNNASDAGSARDRANAEQVVTQFERRLKKLRESDGGEKAIKAVEDRLAQARKELKRLTAAKEEPKSTEPMDDEQLKELVEKAYLRSLTRYPDEREMGRSLAYLREADTPFDGVKDLLWALVNTKEFIVNH